MIGKLLSFSIIALLLASTAVVIVPIAYSQRPVINSQYTNNPPIIDGLFTAGEWTNLQIVMTEPDFPIDAFAYFLNDDSNLYVLVDAIEDTTQDGSDECLLLFDFSAQIKIYVQGTSASATKSSENFDAAIGFDSSPNSAINHKIYEFSIPLDYINVNPGGSIDFCSPYWKEGMSSIVFDASKQGSYPLEETDNVWPPGIGYGSEFKTNNELWGILSLGAYGPVGGIITPTNKLAILTPYLALVALIGAVISIVVRKTRE
ncbi:hypothetical protein [[Eubacterium] cellulosolvens]